MYSAYKHGTDVSVILFTENGLLSTVFLSKVFLNLALKFTASFLGANVSRLKTGGLFSLL